MKKFIFLLVTFLYFFCRGSFIVNYDEITNKIKQILKNDEAITLDQIETIQRENKLNDHQKKIIFDLLIKEYEETLKNIIKPGLESIINGSHVSSKILRGHNGAIRSVCFSADSKRAISSSNDTKIKILDIENQQYISELNYHSDAVPVAVYTKSGKIFSASNDKQVCIWDVSATDSPTSKHSPRIIQKEADFKKVNSAAIGKDNMDREFVVTALDKTIKRWNIDNIEGQKRDSDIIFTAEDTVIALALSFDGKYLCAGLKNGDVYIKKINNESEKNKKDTEAEIKQIKCCKHNACVSCMAISSDGSFFVTGSLDKTVRLWSSANCNYEILFSDTKDGDNCISAIALSHDNRFVMIGSFDSKIRLIDLNSRQIRVLTGHDKTLRTLAFSGNGNYALTGSSDNNVILWFLSKSWLINDLSLTNLVIVLKLLKLDNTNFSSNDYNLFNILNFSIQKYLEKFLNIKALINLSKDYVGPTNILSEDKITNIIADYMMHYAKAKTEETGCRIL